MLVIRISVVRSSSATESRGNIPIRVVRRKDRKFRERQRFFTDYQLKVFFTNYQSLPQRSINDCNGDVRVAILIHKVENNTLIVFTLSRKEFS